MNLSPKRPSQVFPVLVLLGLLCLLAPAASVWAGAEGGTSQCSGYYYTVKFGDTWSKIARRVGATVSTLQSANPQAIRPRDVIYAGEQLCIPSSGGSQEGGYWYQVKPGDTWNSVSRRTGLSVETLWQANPRLVNRKQWLYIGQTIWIPASPNGANPLPPAPTAAATPEAGQVSATETAVMAAALTSVPTATTAATVAPTDTPTAVPTDTPTAVPTDTPTAVPTATVTPPSPPTATPTAAATATLPPTFTPTPSPLPVMPTAGIPTETSTPTAAASPQAPAANPTATPTATATAAPTPVLGPIPADCPKTLAGYEPAIATYLNKTGNTPDTLQKWLVACRVVAAGTQGVTLATITAPRADVIAVLHDPAAEMAQAQGVLLVYHKGAKGYTLAHKHQGQGQVALAQAADINSDGKPDVIYTDTSCGAHTCFGTLFVDSWDGKTYQDWITDEPTMAYPEYTIKDVRAEGQGSEIFVHGGVIGSVGAGPQRAWTETYISSKGAPYVLFSQVYDPSTCLYHKISDANRLFDAWALDGFEPSIEAYKAAVADQNATACGEIKDEVATLRDFARFRLIVADVAAGHAADATSLPGQIANKALAGAATTFVNSYKANTSVIQACRDTTKYAEANPASWQFLADWGYANPSFTAQDLCPLN